MYRNAAFKRKFDLKYFNLLNCNAHNVFLYRQLKVLDLFKKMVEL
jgi:hypothetical protein